MPVKAHDGLALHRNEKTEEVEGHEVAVVESAATIPAEKPVSPGSAMMRAGDVSVPTNHMKSI